MEDSSKMPITLGKLFYTDRGSVELPKAFIDVLLGDEEGEYAIIILAVNQGIMRIVPTSTKKAVKIRIFIRELSDDFIDNVMHTLGSLRLLYSSGVCFADESDCYYECFIEDPAELKIKNLDILPLAKIKESLSRISGVTDVETQVVS